MPRGMLHKVGGTQARDARASGYVKVDRATAGRLYASGVPIIVSGSRVKPEHLLSGHRLAWIYDRQRQPYSWDVVMSASELGLRKNPALGQHLAFFVMREEYPTLEESRS